MRDPVEYGTVSERDKEIMRLRGLANDERTPSVPIEEGWQERQMLAWLEKKALSPEKYPPGRLAKPEAIAEAKKLDEELLQRLRAKYPF